MRIKRNQAILASHFRDGVGLPEKKQLRSCSDRRDRAMSGFSRDRFHGKPGKKNIYTAGALAEYTRGRRALVFR